jgi:hypothetical protein
MKSKPVDVLERRYHEIYESIYRELKEKRRLDPDFTIDDVKGFLGDAYVRQGNDWIGHGALFDATQGATIAAYEAILAEWLEEA